jgi:aromatic ring-cleaving dioxygenase
MSEAIQINGYHAHIYYDETTRATAERLCQVLRDQHGGEYGQSSGAQMGPHPIPQFQVKFTTERFQDIVPWLMLNRDGLDVLVHPLTDSNYNDHAIHALWLGTPVKLKLDVLTRPYGAHQYPSGHPLAAQ